MNSLANIFKALSDQTRLRLVDLLLTHDLCVGALANRLGISKPAVSQHLQVLRKAGLVKGEKRGYWTHYSIERDTLLQLAGNIKNKADLFPFPQGVCQRTVSDSIMNINERKEVPMCNDCCQKSDQLKGKPEECSPEQIKTCHGDEKDHPCVKGGKPDDRHR
jgi:ArsR family transcriptional regulator